MTMVDSLILLNTSRRELLDIVIRMAYTYYCMTGCSTVQAARKLGISMTTMHRYMLEKIIQFPKMQRLAGVRVRVWSEADIEAARATLPKLKNGRKTRHKKAKTQTKK